MRPWVIGMWICEYLSASLLSIHSSSLKRCTAPRLLVIFIWLSAFCSELNSYLSKRSNAVKCLFCWYCWWLIFVVNLLCKMTIICDDILTMGSQCFFLTPEEFIKVFHPWSWNDCYKARNGSSWTGVAPDAEKFTFVSSFAPCAPTPILISTHIMMIYVLCLI